MEKIEDVTQSELEVKLNDGNVYKLGALGYKDYGDFAQYLKSQKLELCNKIEDREIRLKIIEKIMNESITLNELTKEYSTYNGIVYFIWKAVQKYKPDMTLENMNDLIDTKNIEEVSTIVSQLGGTVKNQEKAKK